MLALPGGIASTWQADEDAVLWLVTDEPALAFQGVRPEAAERAPVQATHYRAEDIARELRVLYDRPMAPDTPGRALFMASERTERLCTCLPAMTLTLNAVRPGEAQRPHRHNAAALVLALREARCASTIGGKTFPWTEYVTLLTPAGAAHDHRNAPVDRRQHRDGRRHRAGPDRPGRRPLLLRPHHGLQFRLGRVGLTLNHAPSPVFGGGVSVLR